MSQIKTNVTGREDQRAEALLAIHNQKLYEQTHASFGEYLKERWNLSRSRGYQLVHSARLKQCLMLKGQPPPPNERQARQFAADGTRLPKKSGEDSYEQRLRRLTRNLAANLAKSLPGEHRRFLSDVRKALDHLEQDLDIQPPSRSQGSLCVETQLPGRARPAATDPGKLRQVNRPLSPQLAQPQQVGAVAEVNGGDQPVLSVTTTASHPKGLQTNNQPGSGAVQDRPCPNGNVGSVLGLTMEEARRFGYCSK